MIKILKATACDTNLITEIGKTSFIESHGHSASQEDIELYLSKRFTFQAIERELSNPENIFHIIYHNDQPTGYSEIILNDPIKEVQTKNVTRLERLYLLKEFYDLKLGLKLLEFNIEYSRNSEQSGMWLMVWTENKRAVSFYKKAGFEKVADTVYKISETHSNPNYLMFLKYNS